MQTIISTVSSIVEGGADWMSSTLSTVTSTPLLMFFLMVNFVGIGIGLFKRLTRI